MKRKEYAKLMLKEVETAIREIVAGATSYSISTSDGSKSYTRADLAQLRDWRRELRREVMSYNNRGRPPITMTGVRYV